MPICSLHHDKLACLPGIQSSFETQRNKEETSPCHDVIHPDSQERPSRLHGIISDDPDVRQSFCKLLDLRNIHLEISIPTYSD